MRVVIAPDSFGGTLSSVQAATAIAEGWRTARPQDEIFLAPASDCGPGFVRVLAEQSGSCETALVQGPLGAPTQADWLLDGPAGPDQPRSSKPCSERRTAYLESAQACGLHLLGGPPSPQTALAAQSSGVGQLILEALARGARRIVVGLGGSACTEAGAGMLAALGNGPAGSLAENLLRARAVLAGAHLVAATDVEHPLLGPSGAARVFGPQKGADPASVEILEARLSAAAAEFRRCLGHDVADQPGAGAAGGLGAALFALGATRRSGAELVAERTGQTAQFAAADLVITGEGRLDEQSLHGKAVCAIARAATRSGTPTIALAGQVHLDREQISAAGLVSAHSASEYAGSVELALADAGNQLRRLAERVAADWKTPGH